MKTIGNKIAILLIVCLLGSYTSFAQQPEKQQGKGEKYKIENLVSDLTDSQKDELQVLAKEYREATKELRTKFKEANDELKQLKSDASAKEEEVYKKMEEVASLKTKLDKENYAYKKKIEKVLTPKQIEEMKAKREQMQNERKKSK